ncbi:MAG: hypothetical protein KBA14_01085, partial [Saprospiraceae bacterium]|nr:hypothetical protein [Saprospiraceae bacterium]
RFTIYDFAPKSPKGDLTSFFFVARSRNNPFPATRKNLPVIERSRNDDLRFAPKSPKGDLKFSIYK